MIHSNQYLSFFVKKDSISGEKLTDEVINGYFDVLKSPEKKYKKGKTRELYGSVKEKTGGSRFRIVGKNPENCVGKTGF